MKKLTVLFTAVALALSVSAQQTTTTTKQTTPVMKADSKPVPAENVPNNGSETKACCKGKSAEQCQHHDTKSCSKDSGKGAACCQKGESAKSCSHDKGTSCNHNGKSCEHGAQGCSHGSGAKKPE